MHAANIVELGGFYYFFDSTLESTIYKNNKHKTNGKIILCCAGLGKDEHCQFYSPQVVLPDNPFDEVSAIPKELATSRIP